MQPDRVGRPDDRSVDPRLRKVNRRSISGQTSFWSPSKQMSAGLTPVFASRYESNLERVSKIRGVVTGKAKSNTHE